MPLKAKQHNESQTRSREYERQRRRRRGYRLYDRQQWKRFSLLALRRQLICETPGCKWAAQHVDHVVPIKSRGAPFSFENVQCLCASCHSRKTALRDGGFGRPKALG